MKVNSVKLLGLVGLVLLAGCSGGQSTTTASPSTTQSPTSTTTQASTSAVSSTGSTSTTHLITKTQTYATPIFLQNNAKQSITVKFTIRHGGQVESHSATVSPGSNQRVTTLTAQQTGSPYNLTATMGNESITWNGSVPDTVRFKVNASDHLIQTSP